MSSTDLGVHVISVTLAKSSLVNPLEVWIKGLLSPFPLLQSSMTLNTSEKRAVLSVVRCSVLLHLPSTSGTLYLAKSVTMQSAPTAPKAQCTTRRPSDKSVLATTATRKAS